MITVSDSSELVQCSLQFLSVHLQDERNITLQSAPMSFKVSLFLEFSDQNVVKHFDFLYDRYMSQFRHNSNKQ
jgi:hypothetical protein